MVGVKIEKLTYSGAGNVHSQGDIGLSSVIRKLAQDNARTRINLFTDLTDNSTGVAVYPAVLAAQSGKDVAAFTETGTASAPKAGFDTAIGKVANAMAVLAEHMNRINASLGLPLIVDSTGGTVATAGTIPALDKALTAVSSNCLDVVTGRARLETIKTNMGRLFVFANRIAVAVGETKMTSSLGTNGDGSNTLDAIAASGSSVDGTDDSTIADSVVDAELDTIADNIATIASFLNLFIGAQLSDLTGTVTGTASTTVIEDVTTIIPSVAVDGAATTSSPKAGVDTELGVIEENISELGTRINALLQRNNQTGVLTDSTGISPNGALAQQDVDLTAVDGSSGTNAVDFTTAVDRMGTVADAIASLTAKVNVLCDIYGLPTLTDNSGGTASTTLANIAATGTGVGGVASTILDTVMDAWLVTVANNTKTLFEKLNLMTSATEATDIGLQVVAWDE